MRPKITQPYQPFLLRILHGLTALFAIAAMITAFWTYDTYDGRWGRIPLPKFRDIEGIHGTLWRSLSISIIDYLNQSDVNISAISSVDFQNPSSIKNR